MESPKIFAVIPAAGQSMRMGQSKLLMPWQGRTVIDAVLNAWTSSNVDKVLMVVRGDDAELINAGQRWEIDILPLSAQTPDMKATIIEGLEYLSNRYSPMETDQVLVAPADLPRISQHVIDGVISATAGDQIVVPDYGGKPGHPIRIPWRMTTGIHSLAQDQGLNSFLESNAVHRLKLELNLRPRDIDTPEDYEREIGAD